MELPRVLSCTSIVCLLLASTFATASTLQVQAERERELSATIVLASGGIMPDDTDELAFAVREHNRIHSPFSVQNRFDDPVMFNGVQSHRNNPARDGFINNPARGGILINTRIRR